MAKKKLVFFRYEEDGGLIPPHSISLKRDGDDVFRTEEFLGMIKTSSVSIEEMKALESLIESLGVIKWKRVYKRPDDFIILDGGSWRVEFVYEDGVRHLRRGECCAEPYNFEEFRNHMEKLGIDEIVR